MAQFYYSGFDAKGQPRAGHVQEVDVESALLTLRGEGIFPTLIRPTRQWDIKELLMTEIHVGPPVKPEEFAAFCRQLATLFRAGVDLTASMRILAGQTLNRSFKRVLLDVELSLQQGHPLSMACSKHPRFFSTTFVSMVTAGEATGNLDEILHRTAHLYEKDHATRQKIKAALTYPVFVAVIAAVVVTILFIKILPMFASAFLQSQMELPMPTKIVMGVSTLLAERWYVLLVAILLIVLGWTSMRRTDKGRYRTDLLLLKLPIYGYLIQKSTIARMSMNLSLLFQSAVPTLQAIRITSSIIENRVLQSQLLHTLEDVKHGVGMSQSLKRSRYFPPLLVQMVATGEQTGTLDQMLAKVAEFYEAEVDSIIERIRPLIEPIMIVVLGVVVGTVVLSVIVPMFQIYQNYQ